MTIIINLVGHNDKSKLPTLLLQFNVYFNILKDYNGLFFYFYNV